MATASPTPAPTGGVRRTSQRQALRRPNSRQALNRHESEPPASASRAAKDAQHQYHDDSSEDEIPVPMKLSALTKALLNDGSSDAADRQPHNSLPRTRQRNSGLNSSTSSATEGRRHLRSGSVQAADAKGSRPPTPEKQLDSSPPRKRVVRLSSNGPQSLSQMGHSSRRSTSTSGSAPRSGQRTTQPTRPTSRNSGREKAEGDSQLEDVNTPAQNGRVVRIVTGSSGNRNRIGSLGPSSGRSATDRSAADRSLVDRSVVDRSAVDRTGLGADEVDYEDPDMVARNAPPVSIGSIGRYPSTASKSRMDEHGNPQSSMRVKRVGKLPGSFLSGPARRGRRRQSEEEGEDNGYAEGLVSSQEPESQPADDPVVAPLQADGGLHDFNSGSPISGSAAARAIHRRQASNAELRTSARPSPRPQAQAPVEVKAEEEEELLPVGRRELPSTHDQENEPPASYKRAKPSVLPAAEKVPNRPISVDLEHVKTSPERKPLASIASNTPHRAAPPPPPKMSVLDAATTNAGAATSGQAKQRRNVLKVNGKCYTRLDCVGRGGSAKVYRVSAENGMMYALKRVSLENADESTIKGFRGEIDLLQKLSGVERVINLLDHEMNNEKQVLTLLMEMGELDMNKLLRDRQSLENAKFDPVFVRFYWKEMVECLQQVHARDIVHSDLKPANFVVVRGRLKLIDFGIANAIETDETVNVHRETQIGTPNYMSPESLMDANNPRGGRLGGRPKLMKLGKPSDVWSLGCILYQMVYGVPPFGHIVNQMGRCQAIVNWDHAIEFPSRGLGGVSVPPSLIRTMRRCLVREQHMRPTCDELLHHTDPFLYPAEMSDKALPIDEELLGRIIQSVVTRCKDRMPTEAEILSVWPQAYWASVRKATASRMG